MGLDMYLGRYHRPDITKEHYNVEETKKLTDWKSGYTVLETLPNCFESIARKVTVTNQYYDMEKISRDFANGEKLTIGYMSGNEVGFRNYKKEISFNLTDERLENCYIIEKEKTAYVVQGNYEVAYWRKANQIRQWFVNHIEEFNEGDNGEYYEVTEELLNKLITDCKAVLYSREEVKVNDKIKDKMDKVRTLSEKGIDGEKDGAKETLERMEKKYGLTGISVRPEDILPTSSGFFFGSTEYDGWYYDTLENTIEQCQKVIDETDWNKEVVIYTESW